MIWLVRMAAVFELQKCDIGVERRTKIAAIVTPSPEASGPTNDCQSQGKMTPSENAAGRTLDRESDARRRGREQEVGILALLLAKLFCGVTFEAGHNGFAER